MKYKYFIAACFFIISCSPENEPVSVNYKFNVIRKLDKFQDLIVHPIISEFNGIGVELKNNSSKNIKINFLDSYVKVTAKNNQLLILDDLSYLKNNELIERINRDLHNFHRIELASKESIIIIIETNFNYNSSNMLDDNLEFYLEDILINDTISSFKIKMSITNLKNNNLIYIVDNKISDKNKIIELKKYNLE